MNLKINDEIFVSDIAAGTANGGDENAFLEHLKEKQIHDQTLNIPYPYTEADARWWVNHVAEETKIQGRSINWAIRRQDGVLIGGVGYHDLQVGKSHKAELGYWLAKPFWGRGIATEVVKKITDFGFVEFNLRRVTAHVFAFNVGSARVLEKAGFHLEGQLRNHYKKNGQIFDGKLYAKIK